MQTIMNCFFCAPPHSEILDPPVLFHIIPFPPSLGTNQREGQTPPVYNGTSHSQRRSQVSLVGGADRIPGGGE